MRQENRMTDEEIRKLVAPLLRKSFNKAGFRSVEVQSEEDFDGNPIIRVTANFTGEGVAAEQLVDAQHAIRTALLEKGEDRFVFLDSTYPQEQLVNEDSE